MTRRLSTTAIVYVVLALVTLAAALLAADADRNLFSSGNIAVIMTSVTALGFVAIGQTLVVLVGSLDLSVGYVLSLAGVLCAGVMAGRTENIPVAIVTTLVVCAAIGAANGFVVGVLGLHGFIATLASGLVISGDLSTYYRGNVTGVPDAFTTFGQAGIGVVPVTTLVMLACLGLVFVLLHRTRLGHRMHAVGGDARVARLSGVKTARPIIAAHTLSAVLAGLAGITIVSRLGVGGPNAGTQGGFALLSVAAVVLGGASLAGGRSSLLGTLGGVLIFAVIDSAMGVLQVNPFLKDVVRGLVIVAAVAVFARRTGIMRRRKRFPAGTSA
ncbi:ABC transporter permease [Kibdelosporangium philippinense]|uniref:ABC transporter permease n=1 Tax=Kibdelosporangium philippinense TaxID=211113 RepID=A0ABS8Z6D7_9PSEU|nr:ABC transporter permease [Kibdelosporangium philippinense]MCE7002350.1 ABC transporter permease [Kibdelosporangium philippinense]